MKLIGADETGINTASEIFYLSGCPDKVINIKEGFFDVDSVWPKVEQALKQALDNLVAMRETEGGNIYGDFIYRADFNRRKTGFD